MMLEILEWIAAIIVFGVGSYFILLSNQLISEKKERQRRGISDYYDNPINKQPDDKTK